MLQMREGLHVTDGPPSLTRAEIPTRFPIFFVLQSTLVLPYNLLSTLAVHQLAVRLPISSTRGYGTTSQPCRKNAKHAPSALCDDKNVTATVPVVAASSEEMRTNVPANGLKGATIPRSIVSTLEHQQVRQSLVRPPQKTRALRPPPRMCQRLQSTLP